MIRLGRLFVFLLLLECPLLAIANYFGTMVGEVFTDNTGQTWELKTRLGMGAMAISFLAQKKDDPQNYVLKIALPSSRFKKENKEAMLRGLAHRQTLPHAHLLPLQLLQAQEAPDVPIFLMPLADKTLATDIEKITVQNRIYFGATEVKKTQIDLAYKVLSDLWFALESLQAQSLAHNDIKPLNIVFYKGHWQLIDFDSLDFIENPVDIFTFNFAPPEIRRQQKNHISSDFYALGITLMRILMLENFPNSLFDQDSLSVLGPQFIENQLLTNNELRESYQDKLKFMSRFLEFALEKSAPTRWANLSKINRLDLLDLNCELLFSSL